MTPSQQAKAYGAKTLSGVSKVSGFPVSTLRDMCRKHPVRFKTVCLGSLAMGEA